MISGQLPEIDFSKIRTLGPSKNKGFEELTVQLFRSTFPKETKFYRVDDAGGDGGVEDIAFGTGSTKIGLQAKYFDKLDSTQWTQINKSVRTALKTHFPDLVEYRIATPVNRSKTKKTWSNYEQKWDDYAAELGYTNKVKFTWQGETELRNDLMQAAHKSKVYYWFGCPHFTEHWLKAKYESCKKVLDARYTPEHHVRTDCEQILDAFFLTDRLVQTFMKKWKSLITASQECIVSCQDVSLKSQIADLQLAVESLKLVPQTSIPGSSEIRAVLEKINIQIADIYSFYLSTRLEQETVREPDKRDQYHIRPYANELGKLDEINESIEALYSFITKYKIYDKQLTLVTGEAGTGKSHLLAKAIERALARKQPCLLLAGEQFLTGTPPLEQMCQILGWEQGTEALLGALDTEASIHGKPAIIAIDAVNESNERRLWMSHLFGMAEKIVKYPNIRLVISCRSDFEQCVLPKQLVERKDNQWGYVYHNGFIGEIFDAITTYFKGYKIKCEHFPPLLEEFSNPLFLKTFCEAYQGKSIPRGTIGFDTVMKERIKHCQEMIRKNIDCPEYKTKDALHLIATKIAENNGAPIFHSSIRPLIDALFDGGGASKSLYIHLRSNGMLVETLQASSPEHDGAEVMVRFPYERFSDYFIASKLLNTFESRADLEREWNSKGLPDSWVHDWEAASANRGLLRMMAILIPERFNCEFIQLFNADNVTCEIIKDFIFSLQWRTKNSITSETESIFRRCRELLTEEEYLRLRVKLATIPDHPFNALSLHHELKSMPLEKRELFWTIPISMITSSGTESAVNNLIRWIFKVPESLISNEQAWLASLSLTWLLTSNYRFLRYRATLALIKVLNGRNGLASRLINEFHDCNDPYVVERVYAAACGVALRDNSCDSLGALASLVFDTMFSKDVVPTHILQRDYAQLIMERAAFLNALPENAEISKCKPVFNSKWPHIMSEKEALELEKQEGWYSVKRSLQPESTGFYGDFGRYVMDAAVHRFSAQRLGRAYKKKRDFTDNFKGMTARRYILGRVRQLGWSPETFNAYEKTLNHGRMRSDIENNKIERISKKYQWIGLHELLGSLSDHYWMASGYAEKAVHAFQGAWQLNIRDFDPSQPLSDPLDTLEIENDPDVIPTTGEISWHSYPDPFRDSRLRFDREAWVSASPDNFQTIIEQDGPPDRPGKWLTLFSHLDWEEKLLISQDESKEGQLKKWANIRCWLIRKKDKKAFLEYLESRKFYGHGCDYVRLDDCWIGEYPWASSCEKVKDWFTGDMWINDCPFEIMQTVCGYHNGNNGIGAKLPSPVILELLKLLWSGTNYDYINLSGKLVAYSSLSGEDGSSLFVDRDEFLKITEAAGYVPFWAVLTERSCSSYKVNRSIVKKWAITQRVHGYEKGEFKCYQDSRYEIPLYH